MKSNKRSVLRRIVQLNKQALEHKMFREYDKMKMCYLAKNDLVKKHGHPKAIHNINGRKMVAFNLDKRLFHVPVHEVNQSLLKELKYDSGFKFKIGMKY